MRYFCENCSCLTCSDCGLLDPIHKGHRFVRVKEVAKRQTDYLQNIMMKGEEVKQKFKIAIQETEEVRQNLEHAASRANYAIDCVQREFIQQLENIVKTHKKELALQKKDQARQIDRFREKLEAKLASITSALEQGTQVVASGSEYEIPSTYTSLSVTLQQLIGSQPVAAEQTLGHLKFEPIEVKITSIGQITSSKPRPINRQSQSDVGNQASSATAKLPTSLYPSVKICPPPTVADSSAQVNRSPIASRFTHPLRTNSQTTMSPVEEKSDKRWTQCGHINTFPHPQCIAVNRSGDIAVTSKVVPVTVFSRNGDFKCVLEDSPVNACDIAITPSNRYIIPGQRALYIYNSQSIRLSIIPTYDINNKPWSPNSVAVDSRGMIIVGLGYERLFGCENNTVCIHQPDGTLISKFATPETPRKIACTPDDELVISFDNTLQVMDQSGHNIRIIQPPPAIRSWSPSYLCCSKQGELFVGNWDDPLTVYRYVSAGKEYEYADCIPTTVWFGGIALSANEEELFVAAYYDGCIKIFQR